MSLQPWLKFGFFVPMLAALLLVLAMACGGGATATAVPASGAAEAAAAEAARDAEAAELAAAAAELAVLPGAPKYGGTLVVGTELDPEAGAGWCRTTVP